MGVKQEISAHVDNGTSVAGAVGNSTPQNAATLNSYQNLLRSSSANQSMLQQEASSVFKGPAAMHNGMQILPWTEPSAASTIPTFWVISAPTASAQQSPGLGSAK